MKTDFNTQTILLFTAILIGCSVDSEKSMNIHLIAKNQIEISKTVIEILFLALIWMLSLPDAKVLFLHNMEK